MNTITFSKVDFPELQCEVGKEETLTVTIMPTAVTDEEVTADVTGVAYAETESAEEEPAAPSKGPPRAIVAIGIPSPRSKSRY
jgi:hypothetical protein